MSAERPAISIDPENMEGSKVKRFCCRSICRIVPQATREELHQILKMTVPLLITRILYYLLTVVVTMFSGRLGNEVMAGFGLSFAVINITTVATGFGLALACDTLVSQTFGGKNLLQVGVILQRSVIILMIFCLPCWALLINAQPILLCLAQDPEVARVAQLYITAFLPAVPAVFLLQLQMSYLQNQGIIMPQMYASAMANIANLVTNYVLIHWLDLGVSGSAAANSLSRIYTCVFLFAVIWWRKLHKATWGGWSLESLQEWGPYMKLAIPSAFMKCFEWWVYEFGGVFAGMLNQDELAAQHVVVMIAFITYMFPSGIQAATCARVGNALGAGDTAGATLTTKVALSLAAGFALVEGVVLGSSKSVIGFIFTSDEKIVGLVSRILNAYCALQLFDALLCVCAGIFMGTGKQRIGAVGNLLGNYGIGLPVGLTLMFVVKLGVLGFWLGLLTTTMVLSSFYIIVIFKLNWKKMTEQAVKRAQKTKQVPLLSGAVGNNTTDQTASIEIPLDHYMREDGNKEMQAGHQLKDFRLSTTQLIVRRGLTLLVAVALLVVGVSVHCLVPLPEPPPSEANFTLDGINSTFTTDQIVSTVLMPVEEAG